MGASRAAGQNPLRGHRRQAAGNQSQHVPLSDGFCADNDLRVLDGKTLQAEQQGGAAPLQQAVPDSKTAYASGQLREIAADNTAAAYAALSVLRPMIGSVEQFVAQVNGCSAAKATA